MLRHLSCFCPGPSTKAWVTKAMFRFRGFMDCKSLWAIEMFTVSMRAPPEAGTPAWLHRLHESPKGTVNQPLMANDKLPLVQPECNQLNTW